MKKTGHVDIEQDCPATVAQLNLFDTGIKCWHCGNDAGRKEGNGYLWNGFFDMDCNMYVCFPCRQHHYAWKVKTEHANLYSEFPVSIYNGNHVEKSKK